MDAGSGVRANALLHFLRAADEGDLVDHFLRERGSRPGTVAVRPAFQQFCGGIFVATPREELVVDRIGVVGGVSGSEAVVARLLVVRHQDNLAIDDLDILPFLSGPGGTDPDVFHHLRQRFPGPQVEHDPVAVFGGHLDHLRPQRCEVQRRRMFHGRLPVAVAGQGFEVEVGAVAGQHVAHDDRGLPHPGQRLFQGDAVETGHDRLAGGAEAHDEASRVDLTQHVRGGREDGRRARVYGRDCASHAHPLDAAAQGRQHRQRVRCPGIGEPGILVTVRLGPSHDVGVLLQPVRNGHGHRYTLLK